MHLEVDDEGLHEKIELIKIEESIAISVILVHEVSDFVWRGLWQCQPFLPQSTFHLIDQGIEFFPVNSA